MQMWLYGTRGGAHWPRCEVLESNKQTKQFYNKTLKLMPPGLEAHAEECVQFARAVAEGAPSPVPAEQSLQVLRILDGIYRSQKVGAEVRI
jgi:predicted dehydrogenase